jgi:hypothetical protein
VSADKPRKAGARAFPKQEPKLRLVQNTKDRPRPEPDCEMKEILNDIRRHYRVQRERIEREPDGKDAA